MSRQPGARRGRGGGGPPRGSEEEQAEEEEGRRQGSNTTEFLAEPNPALPHPSSHTQGYSTVATSEGPAVLLFTHPQPPGSTTHPHQQPQPAQPGNTPRGRLCSSRFFFFIVLRPAAQKQCPCLPTPHTLPAGPDHTPDPFLDSLAELEHPFGEMWDAWGSPSALFAIDSPRAPQGDGSGGGKDGGGGGGGSLPPSSASPGASACAGHRPLPPLPSANAQQHPLPVRRMGPFELPVVPPLMLGRSTSRATVVRSDVNPHGGFIEPEPPAPIPSSSSSSGPSLVRASSDGEGPRPRRAYSEEQQRGGGSLPTRPPQQPPPSSQWRSQSTNEGNGHGDVIRSLLAAIPDLSHAAPPSLAGAARSYSNLRPTPLHVYAPQFARSLSAPPESVPGSVGGGGGGGATPSIHPTPTSHRTARIRRTSRRITSTSNSNTSTPRTTTRRHHPRSFRLRRPPCPRAGLTSRASTPRGRAHSRRAVWSRPTRPRALRSTPPTPIPSWTRAAVANTGGRAWCGG